MEEELPPNVFELQRDEGIVLLVNGHEITVTAVDIRGDKTRLGINAPTEIPVHRQEVYDAINRENLRASHGGTDELRKRWESYGGAKMPDSPPEVVSNTARIKRWIRRRLGLGD